MPTAGSLREVIRFDRRAEASDGFGNVTGAWATHADGVPAAIQPANGGEETLAGKLTGLTPAIITIRWRADLALGTDRLTTADRAVNTRSGDIYDIKAIEADPRRRMITLTCEAGGVA